MIEISGVQEIVGDMLVGDLLVGGDDDDGVGEEWDDIMGAKRRPAKRGRGAMVASQRQALANAVAAKRVNGGAIVKEHAYTKARVWPLGFDSTTAIAAGAALSISATPQVPFKPKRLAVWGAVASSFLITAFTIGNQPQFTSLQYGVPADAFGPTAFGTDLECDTAQANTLVLLSVTNLSGAALRFIAALIGQAVA